MAAKKTAPKKGVTKKAAPKKAARPTKAGAKAKTPTNAKKGPAPQKPLARKSRAKAAPSKFTWDPKVGRDRDVARAVFGLFRKRGFVVHSLAVNGEAGARMETFDDQAGVMIFKKALTRFGQIASGDL